MDGNLYPTHGLGPVAWYMDLNAGDRMEYLVSMSTPERAHGMDWDKLRIFQAVADAGSFTHAGEGLKLSQSAISRQIGALEEQLGVMLFHRHARGLILTEQGELLYRTARDMAAKVNTAEALLRANQDKPAGRLKIHATVGFGSTWLTTQMHEFITMYPEIDVSLVLSDNELDLGMREADVAIRMVMPRQPGLVQRHLLTVRSHVYASHTYIQKYGKPANVEDLDKHRLIIFGEDARAPVQDVNWLLREGNPDGTPRTVVLNLTNWALRKVMSMSPKRKSVSSCSLGGWIGRLGCFP